MFLCGIVLMFCFRSGFDCSSDIFQRESWALRYIGKRDFSRPLGRSFRKLFRKMEVRAEKPGAGGLRQCLRGLAVARCTCFPCTTLFRSEGVLRVLGPEATLRRGYSITATEHGEIIRSVAKVRPKMRIKTRVADGEFSSEAL